MRDHIDYWIKKREEKNQGLLFDQRMMSTETDDQEGTDKNASLEQIQEEEKYSSLDNTLRTSF